MGMEQEWKLQARNPATLTRIFQDARILDLQATPVEKIQMQTTYLDTPDNLLSRRRWTLRCRRENEQAVITLKTPADTAHTRGEWALNVEAAGLPTGKMLLQLYQMGAPRQILDLCGRQLIAVCGVRFVRQRCLLRWPDGAEAELALDEGVLEKGTKQEAFCELELERIQGAFTQAETLIQQLQQEYDLFEQPRSKFQRANDL